MVLRVLGAIAFTLLALQAWAPAQELEAPREPDWIPSIEVGFEVFAWDSDDSVQNLVNGPLWSASESSSLTQLLVTIGGQLAGPALESLPGRPRLFLGGGIGIPTDAANETIAIGDPASSVNPEQDIEGYLRRLNTALRQNCLNTIRPCPEPDVEEFRGQGSDIRVILDTPTWYANLGVSFDIPISDAPLLQVRPSVAYRGEKVDLAGRLTTVTCLTTQGLPCVEENFMNPQNLEFTIYRSRTATVTPIYHHLGPRLELALVLSRRARPIRTTFYVEASYLWLLNGGTETLADPDGIATYSVQREQTEIRGGAGIRFSWLGGLGTD